MSEFMTILPGPVGHQDYFESEREYTAPNSPMAGILRRWLDEAPEDWRRSETKIGDLYSSAVDMLKGQEPSIYAAKAAIMQNRGNPKLKRAGLFFSAVCNMAPDRNMTYDLFIKDCGMSELGYMLGEGRNLLVRYDVGENIGMHSRGRIACLEDFSNMGEGSSGQTVSYRQGAVVTGKRGLTLAFGGSVIFDREDNSVGIRVVEGGDYQTAVIDAGPIKGILEMRGKFDVMIDIPHSNLPGAKEAFRELKEGFSQLRSDQEIFSQMDRMDDIEAHLRGIVLSALERGYIRPEDFR